MKHNKGLSLAELSVVIAIIGLLLAAVVGGINVMRGAEIRDFIATIKGQQIAFDTFDSKYRDFPGDMGDAFNYWDSLCDSDFNKCNGDTDGMIELDAADGNDSESFRAWQHLSLAEMLDEHFTGVATTSIDQADIGINVPAAKRAGVGYSVVFANHSAGNRNEITIGAFRANEVNKNGALTPQEALALDKKSDDGIPTTGLIYGADGLDATANDCVNGGAYNATVTKQSCILSFPLNPI